MNKQTARSLVTAIILFAGILTGIIALMLKSEERAFVLPPIPPRALELPEGNLGEQWFFYWQTRKKLQALQSRDSLNHADSVAIKAIDHQLNQLIHD